VTDLPPSEADHSRPPHRGEAGPDRGAGEVVTLVADRLVAGGDALARHPDGRVVLVAGALPGEQIEVELQHRRGALRGVVQRRLWASPDRVRPRCPHVADGCGGCDLQTLEPGAQVRAKVDLVSDALRRLGRIDEPVVRPGPSLSPWGFRTTLRLAVVDGRAGLRRAESHEVVPIEHCLVAHPRIDELVHEGHFGEADEVVLRIGASTGERMAIAMPTATGVELPGDVLVVGADELEAGRRAWIHDEVAGRRWRVSAESFFQTRPDGAGALVEVVRSMVADELAVAGRAGRPRTLLDAYSGVGLFSGALLDGVPGWRAVAAERSRSAVADARHNLADIDAKVVATTIEHLRAPRSDLVVADPSRSGLGRAAVHVLASSGASRVVLVSCDPASAGRDASLLSGVGYRHIESVLVDLFPHTHHTEVVTRFDRV
jgi:23S rRNA (uracil1939-C5)-methyltransferase